MNNKYLRIFSNILFPPRCFVCNIAIKSGILCNSCIDKLNQLKVPLYELYGVKAEDKHCLRKREKVYYDKIISCFNYREPLKTLIHLAKYRHYDYIMDFLASFMIQYLSRVNFPWSDYDLMTNVPSHPVRMREREYNQSAILAKNLSNFLGISLRSGIISCKNNKPSQTTVDGNARAKNVENNFFVGSRLDNADIIIVDDVVTTGSTLSECARTMKKKGAHSILALTLARA